MNSTLFEGFRRVVLGRPPSCATCGREKVEVANVEKNPVVDGEVRMVFMCHGAYDFVVVRASLRRATEDVFREMVAAVPGRVFLRTWARASLSPPARTVVYG